MESNNDPELQKALRKRGDSLRKVNKNFGVEFAISHPDSLHF
jgi:broad-specificity NMP kinase